MINKVSLVFLILISTTIFLLPIIKNMNFYTRVYNRQLVAQKYSNSQYVKGSGGSGIGDDGLYAFAGDYYFNVGDPSQVNFENPPLGKYLIGLSIFIFQNENTIYILYALIIAIATYLLALFIYRNKFMASFSVFILLNSQMFKIQYIPTSSDQLSVTLLDLPLTMFLLLSQLFFLKSKNSFQDYVISSVFLGCACATKFFPAVVIVLFVQLVYVYKQFRANLKLWIVSLATIPLVYLFSYISFFIYHPSLINFLKYQKYLIAWRLGNPIVAGNIFRTILMGKYINWWDQKQVIDTQWTVAIPALVILALLGGLFAIKHKLNCLLYLGSLCIVFLVYLGIGTVGVARYLLPVYPFLVIISVNCVNIIKSVILRWLRLRRV